MELHGITGAPYKHPQIRRKMPAPFVRPSISLDGHYRVKRVWQDTAVCDLVEGDTVAGFGTVEAKAEFIQVSADEVWRIRLYNVMGEWKDFPGYDRVFAFSKEADAGG